MGTRTYLYTIHAREGRNDVVVVPDKGHPLGVLPPVWAIWRGMWGYLAVQVLVLGTLASSAPAAAWPIWFGFVALTVFEGSTVERLEWRLRGWREVALAEARSDEGAEEAWLTGQAVSP